MIKITDLKLLKLIKYFIVNKGYKLVVTKTHSNEVFLESIDKDNYQILYLSSKTFFDSSQVYGDLERVEEVVNKIKKKTFKFKINHTIIYTTTIPKINSEVEIHSIDENQKFIGDKLLSAFPDINSVIQINSAEENNPHLFNSLIQDIAIYTEKKYTNQRKFFDSKTINSNKLLIGAIIILNLMLFFIPESIGLFRGQNLSSIINFVGASSFEMTFINGQYWRPLVSGFISIGKIGLLIDAYLLYVYGKNINRAYGNRNYFIIIILASYFTQLFASMLIPGRLIFGTSPLLAITLGSMIYYAISNRISFIKQFYREVQSNFIIIIFLLVLSGKIAAFVMLFGFLFGFLFSYIVSAVEENDVFRIISSTIILFAIAIMATFGWKFLPKKHSSLYKIDRNYLKIYDDLGLNTTKQYENNICKYYDYKLEDCPIGGFKKTEKEKIA